MHLEIFNTQTGELEYLAIDDLSPTKIRRFFNDLATHGYIDEVSQSLLHLINEKHFKEHRKLTFPIRYLHHIDVETLAVWTATAIYLDEIGRFRPELDWQPAVAVPQSGSAERATREAQQTRPEIAWINRYEAQYGAVPFGHQWKEVDGVQIRTRDAIRAGLVNPVDGNRLVSSTKHGRYASQQ